MTRKDISDELKLAVEEQVQVDPDHFKEKEPLNKLYAFYFFCSKNYSRKKIAELLKKPRHTVESWIRDLSKATPAQIAAIARCKYTLTDVYYESGRGKYEISASNDSDKITLIKKEICSILNLSGISEGCFFAADKKIYLNEDGMELICDMLMNRVKRDQSDQNPISHAVYSDIRNGHFDIKYKSHYEWMLDLACSNLRDISVAYPDYSGVTEYFTEDEVRSAFWRRACLTNRSYNVLPGMSSLGELPDGFYERTYPAILDDIISTFEPLIVAELKEDDCEELKHMKKQRWIKYLGYIYDIRGSERQRILNGIDQSPGLSEALKMMTEHFLPIYSFYSLGQWTKSQDIKLGSYLSKAMRDKEKNCEYLISAYKKKHEDRSEDERMLIAIVREIGKRCLEIGPRMPIWDVIELANERFLDKEKSFVAESAMIIDKYIQA